MNENKTSFSVKSRINADGNPEITTGIKYGDFPARVMTHIVDLRVQATREVLISLGWTPPEETKLEIWINNPNSGLGWVRHSGPFTSVKKTVKRVRDLKLFDTVKGCRFSIREIQN